MCDYPFFIPQVVLFANSSLFWFKVTNEHREFRNYLNYSYSMINQLIDISVRKKQHIYALFPSFCSRFLFEYNSFHLTIWYLSTTRRIRPAVPTPSHVPLSSTNCAERSRKNKEQKKPSYFIKHHDLSGICRMTLQPGFPIQIFHLSSGRRPYRFS